MEPKTIKTMVEAIKGCAEILALLAAALYFFYRLISGYFKINLSLSVIPSRQRSPENGKDYLVVLVKLKKGDRGSLTIHDARVNITCEDGEQIGEKKEKEPIELIGAVRSSYNETTFIVRKKEEGKWVDKAVKRKVITFERRSADAPFINLTPGERTIFSCTSKVLSDKVCQIEVAVLGYKRLSWVMGQWKASVVSLPLLGE